MTDQNLFLNAFMDSCRLLAKFDVESNILYIIKDAKGQICKQQEVYNANDYLDSFLKSGVVYEKDLPQMERLLNREYIKKLCEAHQNGGLTVYRRVREGKLVWTRISIYIPADYSVENPYIVLFNSDMPAEEAKFYESMTVFTDRAYKAAKVNMTKDEYIAVKPYTSEERMQRKRLNIESGLHAEIDFIRDHFVHPDDVPAFNKHVNYSYLRNYFRKKNSEFRFYYRRKVKGLYRWVYLMIVPTAEYSETNETFNFYVMDDHNTILKLLDIRAATTYAQFFSKRNETFSEGYYENLLEILSVFTKQFLDYYLVDLERGLYFNYKLTNTFANKEIPFIGDYTQIAKEYLSDNYTDEEREQMIQFSSISWLKEQLKNRMSVEYTYRYPNGMLVKTTCLKMEAKNGIPTKVLCNTVQVKNEKKMIIRTFGNFRMLNSDETPVKISRKQSIQLMAYLVDRQGYPVTSKDIVADILEKDPSDLNAVKYVSTMIRRLIKDLEAAGYTDLVIKESKSVRLNTDMVDCDYYHYLNGDTSYWRLYHNEYMKEYSWAEETNADLMSITEL